MEVAVLYSGGKDSSLTAYILDKIGYKIKLINANFGVTDSWKYSQEAANELGFSYEVKKFERGIAEKAADIILKDKFPNNGINFIHKYVLEQIAKDHKLIADGTRRDDKAPWLEFRDIRQLEDKYGVEYIAPLRGIGHKTIKELAGRHFDYEENESNGQLKGDYEAEIRALISKRGGNLKEIFPVHVQSRVTRRI